MWPFHWHCKLQISSSIISPASQCVRPTTNGVMNGCDLVIWGDSYLNSSLMLFPTAAYQEI